MENTYEDKKGNTFNNYSDALNSNKGISASNLKTNPTPIKLPTQIETTIPTISMTDTTSPELKAERERLLKEKLTQESGISSLMTSLGLEQGKEAKYVTEAGGDIAQKEYDRYASELSQEQRNIEVFKRDILRNNPTGALRGGQADLLKNAERESLQKQADIAILGNAAKGRFDTALDIAKRKVESNIAPLKAELEAKKFVYENNKDLFSKAELSKLDTLIKADERKIAKEEADKMKGEGMIINALQSKAPQDLITKAKDKLKNGGSLADLSGILGNYGKSIDDKIKDAQLNKLNKEISLLGEPTAKEKKEEAEKLKSKEGQNQILSEKVSLINSILNSNGISQRVGTNRESRQGRFVGIPGVFGIGSNMSTIISEAKGEGQQFAGGVHKLASREFLDALINAKQQGATFGALTDREGDALRAAATKLNDWEIKDKNGMGTGRWNIDEVSFKNELNTLKTLANKGIVNSGGSVINEDEKSSLNTIFSEDNQGLVPGNYY